MGTSCARPPSVPWYRGNSGHQVYVAIAATTVIMAYSHDNRVKYVVRYLYDIDKNGEVDVDEFKQAVMKHCVGKGYAQFPVAFKAFIENQFKAVDVDGDGHVGLPEYRADAITRSAFVDVAEIDEAYNKLVSDADKAAGGISLDRYKELYAQFIGSEAECPAMYLFGPLKEL